VANIQKGASIIKGEMRQAVLDGDIQNYDVERGFTRHVIDEAGDAGGGIILKLGQQSILNHIRILYVLPSLSQHHSIQSIHPSIIHEFLCFNSYSLIQVVGSRRAQLFLLRRSFNGSK